jgi:tRNA (guanine37-N1)-methyltransferase
VSRQPLEFEVFSLFPELVESVCGAGLLGKARERDLVRVYTTDFREFATDKHRTVDDAPFGGGPGMVIRPDVVVSALERVEHERGPFHRVLLTPSAPVFDQSVARRLSKHTRIGLLCGRYEGIDDRVREHHVDECLSIGDFVLNGGEVAAAAIIEAVSRLREGVLGNPDSAREDSFSNPARGTLLEHPHYTRPARFREHDVPEVLLGGDHEGVARWRRLRAGVRTWALRPELRPRPTLSRGHPIWLALDDSVSATQVESVRARCSPRVRVVAGRSRRDLIRQVKKATGKTAWIAGLGGSASDAPVVGALTPALDLLELAQPAPSEEIAPLVFAWPASFAQSLGAAVWFAPMTQPPEEERSAPGLATGPAMIDISQPRTGEDLAGLAGRLCDALERFGA